MDRFSMLADAGARIKWKGANLFPEHLDDPQKTLALGRVKVTGIL